MAALTCAGVSAAAIMLVGGRDTSLPSALSVAWAFGLLPLLCLSVIGRRISLGFIPMLAATVELAGALRQPVGEHRVWWREGPLIPSFAALGALTACASAALSRRDPAQQPALAFWLMIGSVLAWLVCFAVLQDVRHRRVVRFSRAVWVEAGTTDDESVAAVCARLEAEREAELERSREIARREAALSAAGTEAQIRALEQTLLANATSESNRRVRSLETQLAALVGDVARTQAEAVALRAERAALTEQIEMTERQLSEELVTYGQLRNAFERQQQMLERANHRSTRRDWAFFLGGAAISLITFVLGTR
jgi:hypothetical protein